RTDDERMDRRWWILEHQRTVELWRELHLDEILIRLLGSDDEPEDDREEQRRSFERETFRECLGDTPSPVRNGTRALAAVGVLGRRGRHRPTSTVPSRRRAPRPTPLTTRRTARDSWKSSSRWRRSTSSGSSLRDR